jgi:uncharacterized protein (DUF2267 family)
MAEVNDVVDYYRHVQLRGKLRTLAHARRWSGAVLRTLGLNLDRNTKKILARDLPEDLAEALTRVFWLAHFRNTGLGKQEFLAEVSQRSGNTDSHFARYPTLAVFSGLKSIVSPEVNERVAQSLSPEVRLLWQQA